MPEAVAVEEDAAAEAGEGKLLTVKETKTKISMIRSLEAVVAREAAIAEIAGLGVARISTSTTERHAGMTGLQRTTRVRVGTLVGVTTALREI